MIAREETPLRRDRASGHGKMAVCLCGGGLTGAMYEVGCLAAIEDSFERFHASDFDVYVGASSGAAVAMALAGGSSALRMYRALLDPADDFFPLQRHHLLRFDAHELRRVLVSAWTAARQLMSSASARPMSLDVWEELDRFYDSLPAGLFTVDAFERLVIEAMVRRGIPRTFSEMPRKLVLVANDLDAGERAVFGAGDLKDVPVPRAIAASCAIPILYAPVRIGERDYVAGGVGETAHVDLAHSHGCDLVVVINAMVPVRADPITRAVPTGHGRMRRIRDKGLLWVYEQTWRMQTAARLHDGLDAFTAKHPDMSILLLEPEKDEAGMFMYSPMNFAARRRILEVSYTSTRRLLRAPESPLRRALEARGWVSRDRGNVSFV